MEKYSNGSGFTPISAVYIEELDATLVEMHHERSGARLIYLDRKDENKTFAIGFRTLPTDDTGVFHIIEHCVLSGSSKYPVKDPLTELMKSTLYTYVNALTYPDKTLYPVSSKNDKAFMDLVSVYMDAVFHPLLKKNESIFLCEGCRTEVGEDGVLTPSGVVYNEMKGAYSSADELVEHYLAKQMFDGGTYGFDSGGFPESILDLTYSDFVKTYESFYVPSNACIFLDGNIDFEGVLTLLDSTLPNAQAVSNIQLPTLGVLKEGVRTEYYAIDSSEEESNRGRLAFGYRGFPHSDMESALAITAVIDAIAEGNSSPLKKRILASGLCENFYLYYSSGSALGTLGVQFVNVTDGAFDELKELFDSAIAEIISEGISTERVASAISMLEFKTREADFGSYPKGMVFMSAALEFSLLGEDPCGAFEYNKLFSSLKDKLESNYFVDLLKHIVSAPRAEIRLLPDKDYLEKYEKRCLLRMEKYRKGLSDKDMDQLKKKYRDFLQRQESEDTEEALATIPRLSLSDVGEYRADTTMENREILGVRALLHTVASAGITYLDFYFDSSDVTDEELYLLKLYTRTLADFDTECRPAGDFSTLVKSELGDFGVTLVPVKAGKEVRLYLKVSLSFLNDKSTRALDIVKERLYRTVSDNSEALEMRARQMLSASKTMLAEDGSSYALTRTASRYDGYSALRDKLFGYGWHSFLMRIKDDGEYSVRAKNIGPLLSRILTRARLTLSLASEKPSELASAAIEAVKDGGEPVKSMTVVPNPVINEGISVPATVGYAAAGGSFLERYDYDGSFTVASTILSYEYLWSEVRLAGGAYDTGFIMRPNSGIASLYSYRDPNPGRTVSLFASVGDKIREYVRGGGDITSFIISTVGSTDPASTPRSASSGATLLYLSGKSLDDNKRMRREILDTTPEKLVKVADMLDSIKNSVTYTVIASRDELIKLGITNILEI